MYPSEDGGGLRRTFGSGGVEAVSLDYDLHPNHYARDYSVGLTGAHVLLWMKSKIEQEPDWPMPLVRFHSWNEEGRAIMRGLLEEIREIREGQAMQRGPGKSG